MERLLAVQRGDGGGAAITALDGMSGLDKATLAVQVGHLLAEHFPDGQILIALAGTSEAPLTPEAALAQVIGAFHPLAQLLVGLENLQAKRCDGGLWHLSEVSALAALVRFTPIRRPG